jgi:hypothetical protein
LNWRIINILAYIGSFNLYASAILIFKIGFLKVSRRRTFKKPILGLPSPQAMATPKLV